MKIKIEWLIMLFGIIVILLLALAAEDSNAQTIDAPSAVQKELARNTAPKLNPAPKFMAFRKGWDAPPLRTNKQVFTAKWSYVVPHILLWGAMAAAVRNKRSGEDLHSELPAVAAVTGLDFLAMRLIGAPVATGAALYGTDHYLRAAVK